MTLLHFQLFSAAMFCLGLYGVLARRSAVLILMAIELMLNAVNVNLVAFGAFRPVDTVTGQVIAIFVITIAAAEVAWLWESSCGSSAATAPSTWTRST